jgi:hypothetical protein
VAENDLLCVASSRPSIVSSAVKQRVEDIVQFLVGALGALVEDSHRANGTCPPGHLTRNFSGCDGSRAGVLSYDDDERSP